MDWIRINNLHVSAVLSTGASWPLKNPASSKAQPLLVTVSVCHDISQASATDDLSKSINYSALASLIPNFMSSRQFQSLEALSRHICDAVLSEYPSVDNISLEVVQLKGPLPCKQIRLCSEVTRHGSSKLTYYCDQLQCDTIIGINDCERIEKQPVVLSFSIQNPSITRHASRSLDFRSLARHLYEGGGIASSSFLTLEALTSHIAEKILAYIAAFGFLQATTTVKVAKPRAIVFAESAEVEIRRHSDDIFLTKAANVIAIALGSNLGDRFQNIETALRLLESPQEVLKSNDAVVSIVDTSFLYETPAMYVTDQPMFLNCACLIETNLSPFTLLELVKRIEVEVGRTPSFRNGPRVVDLDIIFYNDLVLDTRNDEEDDVDGQLIVPHPRMSEREFVLRPLNDMIANYIHPTFHKTVAQLLEALASHDAPYKVVPFPRYPRSLGDTPSTLTYWKFPSADSSATLETYMMGTLNVTPDSFSDGGLHNTTSAALEYSRGSVLAGAAIIDVGGYSSRPGASFVSVEDEISRVGPVIHAMRRDEILKDIPFSIDTFRPQVAKAAIEAGANCINDVYAFTGPDSFPDNGQNEDNLSAMKTLARQLAVPVVLMHSRGDAGSNKDYESYGYAQRKFIEGVCVELGQKVDRIVKGKRGLRRWLVIVDPGIGFSKPVEGNLELIKHASTITSTRYVGPVNGRYSNPLCGFPLLIGTSRKSFLSNILGRSTEAKERGWATAAAVSYSVQQGTPILRVHDVQEMKDVVAIAQALRRA